MRFIISCLIIVFISSVEGFAQFFLAEDFSRHDNGASVANAADVTNPDTGEWICVQESGDIVPTVVADQLSYNDYIYSARGKTLSFVPASNRISAGVYCLSQTHLPYPCQPEGGFVDGSNEFYVAFMLNVNGTTTGDVQEIFSFYQLSSGQRRGSLFFRLSPDKTKVAFSFQKRPDEPSTVWTQEYDKSRTLLLVVKYSHVCINEKNLGHSEFELFINPNPLKSEDENILTRTSAYGNDSGYDTDLRYISFRQSGETNMKVAGIRIANSFEKVLCGPDDNTSIPVLPHGKLLFYAERKTLFPQQEMNGKLTIYDLSSRCLQAYDVQGKEPVSTTLEQGVYILYYENDGDTFVQKVLIR